MKIGGSILRYTKNNSEISSKIQDYEPATDEMTRNESYKGIENIVKKFSQYEDLVIKIGSLLGGYDFETHKMVDRYRIVSNAITSKDDYSDTLTTGRMQHPSSSFAGNNSFFNIMYFIQNSSEQNSSPQAKHLHLKIAAMDRSIFRPISS